jgi:hypothetical protein
MVSDIISLLLSGGIVMDADVVEINLCIIN